MIKHFITISAFVICLRLFFSFPAFPAEGNKLIQFNGQLVSAELKGVTLRLIIEQFQKEKKIWYRAEESLLEEKISTHFKDLPLQKALGRILARMNHVLVFDKDKQLIGLFIFSKEYFGGPPIQHPGVITQKEPHSAALKDASDSGNRSENFPWGFLSETFAGEDGDQDNEKSPFSSGDTTFEDGDLIFDKTTAPKGQTAADSILPPPEDKSVGIRP